MISPVNKVESGADIRTMDEVVSIPVVNGKFNYTWKGERQLFLQLIPDNQYADGNIGKAIFVVIMIMQIAGSGGSYPIELLPGFFQQAYLFFPFPYAINAMREAIAGLYQNNYLIYTLQLLLFFAAGLFIGLVLRRSLSGLNKYMDEQLEKTEMM